MRCLLLLGALLVPYRANALGGAIVGSSGNGSTFTGGSVANATTFQSSVTAQSGVRVEGNSIFLASVSVNNNMIVNGTLTFSSGSTNGNAVSYAQFESSGTLVIHSTGSAAGTLALQVNNNVESELLHIGSDGNIGINQASVPSGFGVFASTTVSISSLTVAALGGSGTRCVQVGANGLLSASASSCGGTFSGGGVANATTFQSSVTMQNILAVDSAPASGIAYGIGVPTTSISGKPFNVIDSSFSVTATTSTNSSTINPIIFGTTRTIPANFVNSSGSDILDIICNFNHGGTNTGGKDRILIDGVSVCASQNLTNSGVNPIIELRLLQLTAGLQYPMCTCYYTNGNSPGASCSSLVGAAAPTANLTLDMTTTHTVNCGASITSPGGDINYINGPIIHVLK